MTPSTTRGVFDIDISTHVDRRSDLNLIKTAGLRTCLERFSELPTYFHSAFRRCVRLNWSHENVREVFCHSKWLYTVCSRLD
jgi:hypothetical protein